jgi:hypothetical protein
LGWNRQGYSLYGEVREEKTEWEYERGRRLGSRAVKALVAVVIVLLLNALLQ